MLLGQQAVVDLQLAVSGVQETVTVTGESPLLDLTSSSLGGNIDPRQMQELPVNGRNWMDLSLLSMGSRTNAVVEDSPLPGRAQGHYQINVDGQQVTNNLCCGSIFGNPRYSRDAIAEFELISNRFDATQGRAGISQVNAITKSGTNTPSGSLAGYFRDDSLNAADFIADKVLPYSNQQVSGTFGGPIRENRVHFFGYYEYEREPQTDVPTSPFPSFNVVRTETGRQNKFGGRLDVQFTPERRFAVRANRYTHYIPFLRGAGSTIHPSGVDFSNRYTAQVLGTLTDVVLGGRAVNELRAGYARMNWANDSPIRSWAGAPKADVRGGGGPTVRLFGYRIGGSGFNPQWLGNDGPYSIRDDFTLSFNKAGRHDVKLGGEFLYQKVIIDWCLLCLGALNVFGGFPPSNLEELFPVWNDPTTWNLSALSPIATSYQQAVGSFVYDDKRWMYGMWLQDDWAITSRLTLNLGLRWDPEFGGLGEKVKFEPFMSGDRPADTDNIAPRLGFAFSLNDQTVIRGGWGKYFGEVEQRAGEQAKINILVRIPEVVNDGSNPNFGGDPFAGPTPTFDEMQTRLCPNNPAPDCLRHDAASGFPSLGYQVPYGYQASIGMQRQLGDATSVEANYVWTATRADQFTRNQNLSYDPATGINLPFSDISSRPFPDWGTLNQLMMEGRSNYHALETGFTKRFSQRWQLGATYTLSALWDEIPSPVSFKVAPDLGGEYSLASTDQRHRGVLNGIWDMGYDFQLSGLYFFGSGQRYATFYGGDLRDTGAGFQAAGRLRPDGTIVARNSLVGEPIHRVDLRLQRRFRLAGRASVDGILEVFNLLNHENFGSYTAAESNANFGKPTFNGNRAYAARQFQLGFRFLF